MASTVATAVHGSLTSYVKFRCRCPECLDAGTAYHRDLRTWKRDHGKPVRGWRKRLQREMAEATNG